VGDVGDGGLAGSVEAGEALEERKRLGIGVWTAMVVGWLVM